MPTLLKWRADFDLSAPAHCRESISRVREERSTSSHSYPLAAVLARGASCVRSRSPARAAMGRIPAGQTQEAAVESHGRVNPDQLAETNILSQSPHLAPRKVLVAQKRARSDRECPGNCQSTKRRPMAGVRTIHNRAKVKRVSEMLPAKPSRKSSCRRSAAVPRLPSYAGRTSLHCLQMNNIRG